MNLAAAVGSLSSGTDYARIRERWVGTLAVAPSILTYLLWSAQASVRIIPPLGHDCSLPDSFQFISHPTIRRHPAADSFVT